MSTKKQMEQEKPGLDALLEQYREALTEGDTGVAVWAEVHVHNLIARCKEAERCLAVAEQKLHELL